MLAKFLALMVRSVDQFSCTQSEGAILSKKLALENRDSLTIIYFGKNTKLYGFS